MKKQSILKLTMMAALAVTANAQIITNDFVQRGSAQLSREDELYNQGQRNLNESRWGDAVQVFDQVIDLKGSRSAAALYWKAFALNKQGRAQEALDTISTLRRSHPNTKWSNDARALEIEIKGPGSVASDGPRPSGAQTGGAVTCDNEELKLLALNRLMDRDEARAVPLLEKFLQNKECKRLRERALFVLGQSDNDQAAQMITRIAKGELYPELQTKAIHQIGVVNANERNMQTLSQIYATGNYDVKRTILHTFGINGSKELLMKAVRSEQDPKLQRDAIHGLGISGAKTELRQLYKELPGYEGKSAVLDAFIVAGDGDAFAEVARTETDPKLRRKAIQGIGIHGGRGSGPALVAIYQGSNDPDSKKAALEGLFVSDNARALIDLARAERDPEMKKRIVEKLSVMDNKEATDYMIEILNK